MEECNKELCSRCAIRDWCDHRLDVSDRRNNLIQRMIDAAVSELVVR